ncbi:MAG: polysaccharide deacetylase family protein [Gemmataceae bacterium]
MSFPTRPSVHRLLFASAVVAALLLPAAPARAERAGEETAKVYVVLWFDTEDYLLPASDDAALHLAQFLSGEDVRATFKVVGEKARTLERRKRVDVIAALKKHEIGFHSNFHSTQPSPALYLSPLGWDEGVREFDRREGPGRDDVERIFGQAPSCYGQPGSSWGPQSYGGMRRWGMKVYLDAGNHVNLNDRPCYYCGTLNLYKLAHTIRADLNNPKELPRAEERFAQARKELLAEGGGVVSIFYHPCEFVHKQFWDGVNFSRGSNPPREKWKEPPAKTREETLSAYRVFEEYVRFIKRFPEVRFITASEAANLYRDQARVHRFAEAELRAIAGTVGEEVSFQTHKDYALSASEVFALLNAYVDRIREDNAKTLAEHLTVTTTPLGPTGRVPLLSEAITTDASQFRRTCRDVADYLEKHGRIPSAVWLGSRPVPPEAYLAALARIALLRLDGKAMPESIEIKPAKLAAARFVSDDDPKKLWGWVIFPPGFRAAALMELAKKQAWTLKPAIPHPSRDH